MMTATLTKTYMDGLYQFDAPTLKQIADRALAIRLERLVAVLTPRESMLLSEIHDLVLPIDKSAQYDELHDKLTETELDEIEQAALLELVDEIEWLGVARLEKIIELAEARHTTIDDVMQTFDIQPNPHVTS